MPIDRNARQVCALIVFKEGITEGEARTLINAAFPASNSPEVDHPIDVQVFNPTMGGVCIYQP